MRTRTMMVIGGLFILLGVLALISNLTGINFSAFCFPIGLIALGAWVLLRPRTTRDGAEVHVELLGEIRREGNWAVSGQEFWSFIGDTKLNFSQAQIPEGETLIRVYNLIGDISLTVPADFGLALVAETLVSSVRWFGSKRDNVLSGVELTTPAYATAARRVRVQVVSLVGDVKVKLAE